MDVYKFAQLVMADGKYSMAPWQEAFIKSLGQPRTQFVYRPGRVLRDELMWQVQLEIFKEHWSNGKTTVMFSPNLCDVRKTKVVVDELSERFKEVMTERDALWYQKNYLNPWSSDEQ
jgi:hypothetical protein